jgi:rod shape determining protein RodA
VATRVAHPDARAASWDVGAILRNVDYVLLGTVAVLVGYGLWILSTVTSADVPGDPRYYLVRQGFNVGVGVIALLFVLIVDPDVYRRYRRVLYAATIGMMGFVFVAGAAIRGSRRWIDLGFFRLQPSELGKVLLILFLAGFLADRGRRVGEARTTLAAVGLAAIPVFLVFLEPDVGTAIVYCAALAAVLFLAGSRWRHLVALALVAIIALLAVLWFLPAAGVQVLQPYQTDRLTGFLHPDSDPTGATYNVNQSITAVGAGGLDGRGVAGATQTRLDYLPEHATDFVFSSLAEQRGFLGASILLLLYALIAWRAIKVIAVAPDLYSATVAGAIVVAFLVQVFVNVGMTTGMAPITGITLPFVSYGGSSMLASLIMIGVLEAIHVRGRLAGRS